MKDTPPTPPPKPSILLNIDDWMPYLADENISEREKIKLIETLWTIVLHFVDLGYDYDDSEIISGQGFDLTAVLRAAVVVSSDEASGSIEATDRIKPDQPKANSTSINEVQE